TPAFIQMHPSSAARCLLFASLVIRLLLSFNGHIEQDGCQDEPGRINFGKKKIITIWKDWKKF
ncbi:MAG: hypothetical protein V3V76_05300, partial [Candidatus Adiutricales bacterium]